jgi:hypothetical protein
MPVTEPEFIDPDCLPSQTDISQKYGILNAGLGEIEFISRRPTMADATSARSLVGNQINFDRMGPEEGEGIVDWESTPALFWRRSTRRSDGRLGTGDIGSQADAMHQIGEDYKKWVNRVTGWVRRNSTKVMQNRLLTSEASGLRIKVAFSNAVYAMPDAMHQFRNGVASQYWAQHHVGLKGLQP